MKGTFHSQVDGVIVVVVLSMVDDLLGVVEQEAPKEHQTPVHVDGVQPGEDGGARGSKHAS